MRRKGFTFIELLVVIAIICILAAILYPVFARATKAKRTADKKNHSVSVAQAARSPRIYTGTISSRGVVSDSDGCCYVTIKLENGRYVRADTDKQKGTDDLEYKTKVEVKAVRIGNRYEVIEFRVVESYTSKSHEYSGR